MTISLQPYVNETDDLIAFLTGPISLIRTGKRNDNYNHA